MLGLKTPRAPTASTVAEEGGIQFPDFPSHQSIYNHYDAMLRIWRIAYRDIHNVAFEKARLKLNPIEEADIAALDSGTRANILRLQGLLNELQHRNNGLKEFIRENVPLKPDPEVDQTELVLEKLGDWLGQIGSDKSGFLVDDLGIRVSRRTPVGTIVMEKALFDGLQKIVIRKQFPDGAIFED